MGSQTASSTIMFLETWIGYLFLTAMVMMQKHKSSLIPLLIWPQGTVQRNEFAFICHLILQILLKEQLNIFLGRPFSQVQLYECPYHQQIFLLPFSHCQSFH